MRKPLGEVLKQARESAGISQRDLARLTDLPTGQISKIETGVSPYPSFLTIARIAESLKVSLDVIASRCASGSAPGTKTTLGASDHERLVMLREIETAVREGEKTLARLRALLAKESPSPTKQSKRKHPAAP